jgi:hypothetical protein
MRRPYIAESAIEPGCGVVQGSADTKVKAPVAGGAGSFIGVYAFEANAAKEAKDPVGIAITGVVKVLAGGAVNAGTKAVLKGDTSGMFVNVPAAAGQYATCGTFLESGAASEYVDMLIEHGSVTIPEEA